MGGKTVLCRWAHPTEKKELDEYQEEFLRKVDEKILKESGDVCLLVELIWEPQDSKKWLRNKITSSESSQEFIEKVSNEGRIEILGTLVDVTCDEYQYTLFPHREDVSNVEEAREVISPAFQEILRHTYYKIRECGKDVALELEQSLYQNLWGKPAVKPKIVRKFERDVVKLAKKCEDIIELLKRKEGVIAIMLTPHFGKGIFFNRYQAEGTLPFSIELPFMLLYANVRDYILTKQCEELSKKYEVVYALLGSAHGKRLKNVEEMCMRVCGREVSFELHMGCEYVSEDRSKIFKLVENREKMEKINLETNVLPALISIHMKMRRIPSAPTLELFLSSELLKEMREKGVYDEMLKEYDELLRKLPYGSELLDIGYIAERYGNEDVKTMILDFFGKYIEKLSPYIDKTIKKYFSFI